MSGVRGSQNVGISLRSDDEEESLQIETQKQLMVEFMTVMSVAHEVVAEDPSKLSDAEEDDLEDPSKLIY